MRRQREERTRKEKGTEQGKAKNRMSLEIIFFKIRRWKINEMVFGSNSNARSEETNEHIASGSY